MRSARSAVSHVAALVAIVLMATLTVAETQSSKLVSVPSSIDATGIEDVTAELMAFLASVPDGSTIAFPAGGKYRIEGTLELADRNDLAIEGNGSMFFADTDGTGVVSDVRTRYHWRLTRGSNIVLRNLVIRGAHPNGGKNGDYVKSLEAQHGIDIAGTVGVLVDAVRITDVYGDFIHVSRDPKNFGWTKDLTIRNSHMERNGRQGVALTGVDGALVSGNTITDTRRATFDLEPDSTSLGAVNVRIENNYIGPGQLLFIANAGADGIIQNIAVVNNRLDRTMSILVRPPDTGTKRRGPFLIEGNVSSVRGGSKYSDGEMQFHRTDGVTVRNNVQHVTQYNDAFFAGVAYWETCTVDVSGNDFTGADAESHNFTPDYVCPEPVATTDSSTDSTTTTTSSTTTTTTTTVPESAYVRIGDLDGSSTNLGPQWTATVTAAVLNESGAAVNGAAVYASWSDGTKSSCTTGSSGRCSLQSATFHKRQSDVTLAVTKVVVGTTLYDATKNSDPDGDSNGTKIVVRKP